MLLDKLAARGRTELYPVVQEYDSALCLQLVCFLNSPQERGVFLLHLAAEEEAVTKNQYKIMSERLFRHKPKTSDLLLLLLCCTYIHACQGNSQTGGDTV